MTHQLNVTIDDETNTKINNMIAEYLKQGLKVNFPTIMRMALKKMFEGEEE